MKTLAELTNELFDTHRKPNGKAYTNWEVSEMLNGAIEGTHLRKLRRGIVLNPKRDTLLALCRFFKVSPDYFFPELPKPSSTEGDDPVTAVMRLLYMPPAEKQKLEAFLRALVQHSEEE